MKNELPQNWVIDTHKEKDSPLMSKFMEWYKENQTLTCSTCYKFIGFSGDMLTSWIRINSQTLITLEQWNAFYFPEWQPKQGEVVLASNDNSYFVKHLFVHKYKDVYYCEKLYSDIELIGFLYVKPLPKESILQPLVDQLKAEAEKLGLKVNIAVE